MTMSATDKTNLNLLTPNLAPNQVALSALRLTVFQEIYNYLDSIINDLNAAQAAGSVTSAKLADGSVITVKIADSAVTGPKILDGAIITAKLSDGSVTTTKVADGTVTAQKLGAASVTTIKLADGSITAEKLTDAIITTSRLVDNSVTSQKIAPGSVTNDKIASGVITADKFVPGVLTNETANGLEIAALKAEKVQKGELVINVKDYGAKGDAVTDDSVAFQNAINYAKTTNFNALFVPPGSYKIDQAARLLIDKASFTLTGGGYDNTTILFTHVDGGFTFDIDNGGTIGPYRVQLRDIRISGNNTALKLIDIPKHVEELIFYQTVLTQANPTTGILLNVDDVALCWVSKCDFTYAGKFIEFNSLSNFWIEGINFWEIGTVFHGKTICYFTNVRDSWFEHCDRIFYGGSAFTDINIRFESCAIIKNKGTSAPVEFEVPVSSNCFGFYNCKITVTQNIGTFINLISPNTNAARVLRLQFENCFIESSPGTLSSLLKTTTDSLSHLAVLFSLANRAAMFTTADSMINGKGYVNSILSEVGTLSTGSRGIRFNDAHFYAGRVYYDQSTKRLRVTNEADLGQIIARSLSGPTANRPTDAITGERFYDTTLGKPIWWSGTVWKDASGTTV